MACLQCISVVYRINLNMVILTPSLPTSVLPFHDSSDVPSPESFYFATQLKVTLDLGIVNTKQSRLAIGFNDFDDLIRV